MLFLVESNFPNKQLLLFVFAMQTSLDMLSQAQTFLRISQFAARVTNLTAPVDNNYLHNFYPYKTKYVHHLVYYSVLFLNFCFKTALTPYNDNFNSSIIPIKSLLISFLIHYFQSH